MTPKPTGGVKPQGVEVDPSTVTSAATSQRARQVRTTVTAARHGQSWTAAEDAELAACSSNNDLEAFALRWGRRFLRSSSAVVVLVPVLTGCQQAPAGCDEPGGRRLIVVVTDR